MFSNLSVRRNTYAFFLALQSLHAGMCEEWAIIPMSSKYRIALNPEVCRQWLILHDNHINEYTNIIMQFSIMLVMYPILLQFSLMFMPSARIKNL